MKTKHTDLFVTHATKQYLLTFIGLYSIFNKYRVSSKYFTCIPEVKV